MDHPGSIHPSARHASGYTDPDISRGVAWPNCCAGRPLLAAISINERSRDLGAFVTFDWKTLREPAPTSLASARQVAHYAAQWIAQAARANLQAAPDDSHSALTWDASLGALVSGVFPGGTSVGLHLESLELLVIRDPWIERLGLHGVASSVVDDWLVSQLTGRGYKSALGGEAAICSSRTIVEQRARPALLKILGRKTSGNTQKVLWCCDELGLTYEREDVGRGFGRSGVNVASCGPMYGLN